MISEYNNIICPKLIEYIKSFLVRIEASVDEVTIKIKKFNVIETNDFDINYLITRGLTGTYTLKVYFEITRNGSTTEFSEDLEVPKMINNVFVIEGNMRVPTNTLDNDNIVSVYRENVRINNYLNITYQEDEHQQDGYLLIVNIYDDDEPITFEGTEENFQQYKDYLKLDQIEKDKIKVKLDTDDVGDYLTRDKVIDLINLGTDKSHDSMIDKKIFSAESNLLNYLNSIDIRKKISASMKSKFIQYNRIYLRDIQNALNRYFIIASEKNIDIPSTVNPLIFDAMKYKIVIPENVAFNNTMTDLIDVANTPINQNVNRINELNVCTIVKDDKMYIRCYTYPDQEPVEVLYSTYCTKKVLLNQYWDYENRKFKDGVTTLNYRLRMKSREGTINDKFDYIEPQADDKLSITTRRIPLGNFSDSVRVSMATSMEKQALELQDSEPSLITAGYDDADFELSTLVTPFKGNESVITKIEDNKIFIKDNATGSVQFYEIPNPTPSANDSIISFDTNVKVGQVIKDGDVLIVPHMLKKKAFELGVNAYAVYMNYLGYSHEDGMIISETLANKMIHYSIIDVYQEIYPDDIIKYIRKIGSKVTSKDILSNIQTRLRINQSLKDTYTGNTGLLQGMGINYNQSNLTVPNNIDEGYVIDVKVFIDPQRQLTNDTSLTTIEEFKKASKLSDYDFLPEKFRNLKANDVDYGDKVSGYISYKILRVDRCKIGDKLANRYGGKGIVSLVLPDNCMPQIIKSDGTKVPSEIILNPAGVLHRKNISQLYECALSKIIFKLNERVTTLVEKGDISTAKALLNKFKDIYKDKFSELTDEEFATQFREEGVYFLRMPVGFFSKVTYDQVLSWLKDLGIEESDKIYCPDVTICETKQGLKAFESSQYKKGEDHMNVKSYELGYCEQPCITGHEYMMKLWKQASYDGKVTSEVLDTDQPVMGKGKYRFEGQKIGEMELWILIGSGIESFVQKQSETMKSSQYLFLNELLLSGYFIQDAKGSPLLSNSRSKAEALEALGK
jgi:hypothetical protein